MGTEPGVKDDSGKVRMDLVIKYFPGALREVAKVSAFGAEKYCEGGWRTVPDGRDRYLAAMMRHLLQSSPVDNETGLLHLSHVAWNALAILELKLEEEK